MTDDPRIEKIAVALRDEAETFQDPIKFYVIGEAERRGLVTFDEDEPEKHEMESWKILARAVLKALDGQRFFVVDFKYGNAPVDTRIFDYDTQQADAENFCKAIRQQGGLVNIRILNIGATP